MLYWNQKNQEVNAVLKVDDVSNKLYFSTDCTCRLIVTGIKNLARSQFERASLSA